jgi:hypothetical protein
VAPACDLQGSSMSLKRRLKEAYQQALRKMFELGQLF